MGYNFGLDCRRSMKFCMRVASKVIYTWTMMVAIGNVILCFYDVIHSKHFSDINHLISWQLPMGIGIEYWIYIF